ncbi:MAG: hypothetical protein PHI35_07595 [Victivallaceae bacterium]|nr:hypothetical protein [Victivallaceae bacterium]
MKKIVIIICAALLTASALQGETATPGDILRACSDMDFGRIDKLVTRFPASPEARLGNAFAALFDPDRQNIPAGLAEYAAIFADETLRNDFRAEAGLTLGRTVQLMRARPDLYDAPGDAYNYIAILHKTIRLAPDGAAARDAMLFIAMEKLDQPGLYQDQADECDRFIRDFHGDRRLLVPLWLLLEYQAIRQKGDYQRAVECLEQCVALGFANPAEEREARFRVANLAMLKLHDYNRAEKYFTDFVRRYPFSMDAVTAKRHLNRIAAEKNAARGGI